MMKHYYPIIIGCFLLGLACCRGSYKSKNEDQDLSKIATKNSSNPNSGAKAVIISPQFPPKPSSPSLGRRLWRAIPRWFRRFRSAHSKWYLLPNPPAPPPPPKLLSPLVLPSPNPGSRLCQPIGDQMVSKKLTLSSEPGAAPGT